MTRRGRTDAGGGWHLRCQPPPSWLVAGAVVGVTATAARTAVRFWFPGFGLQELLETRWLWLFDGLVSGACLGALAWMLRAPRAHATVAVRVLTTMNCAAWLSFLLFTSPAPAAHFEEIARQRAEDGTWFVTDQPTIVAGRFFGGWRAMPLAERWLVFMADPAIMICRMQVVPVRHIASDPTRRESYVIAALALLVSTGFWVIAGRILGGVGAFVARGAAARSRGKADAGGAP